VDSSSPTCRRMGKSFSMLQLVLCFRGCESQSQCTCTHLAGPDHYALIDTRVSDYALANRVLWAELQQKKQKQDTHQGAWCELVCKLL